MVKKVNTIQAIDPGNLCKKTDYNPIIAEIEKKILDHDQSNKYITRQEFNKLTTENVTEKSKPANSATKAGIDDLLKKDKF